MIYNKPYTQNNMMGQQHFRVFSSVNKEFEEQVKVALTLIKDE